MRYNDAYLVKLDIAIEMDTNLNERLGSARFPTKGLILDTIAKGLGIELSRKDIQRLIKEEKISADKAEALINQMVVQIVESFNEYNFQRHGAKIQAVITKFLHFYTDFLSGFETYKVSQKQLNYLLLKDLFIPLASDIMAAIFDENISILSNIKPDSGKTPVQKMFDLIEKHVPTQKSFLNYLVKKYEEDIEFKPSYSTVRDNLNGWMNGSDLPKVNSIKQLSDYIQNDIEDETARKLINPLFLVARLMQEGYASLLKIYDQTYVDMLVEHFYLLLKFYSWSPKFIYPDDLREFIYTTYFRHVNPNILNRDFYFDDYYLFMINILYTRFKHKDLIEYGMQRNGLLYHLSEDKAFKYMKLFLPVKALVGKESLDSHAELDVDFKIYMIPVISAEDKTIDPLQWKEDISKLLSNYEKVLHMLSCLFFTLLPKRAKTYDEQLACEGIFAELDAIGTKDVDMPYVSWLKSRFFAFCGDYLKALDHYKIAADVDKGRTSQHYWDVITEGILLSAKCKNKLSYNKFYKLATMENILKYQMLLKIPANAKVYILTPIDESNEAFQRLSEECDQYFKNCFPD